ncbi:MAG TPA: glycosyltransferase family 39 protein, partial [Vicinamibacterales bacterium]|nr:glycosyltransferase family 39 protein [Vicinamibacterales bacterium]
LANQPVSRWIAPEWGGAWDQQGLFREHPVGILIPSVLAIRAGFPREQAPYAVNMLYQAAVIVLIPLIAGALVTRTEARALASVLQLLPIAFVYRIRGNQEPPLLMCFLALLYGAHKARSARPWVWVPLMMAALCLLVLIKGAFATFAVVATALWLLIVPAADGDGNRRGWIGLAIAAASAALMAAGYEALYVRTTGESFVEFYRSTRLGESMRLRDPGVIPHAFVNIVWYLGRLAWFAAPWSLAAATVVCVWMRSSMSGGVSATFAPLTRRGLAWSLLVAAVFIAVLSPANVRAERFIFPVYFIIGGVGFVAAVRSDARVHALAAGVARHRWAPVAVWFTTFLLSLGSRLMR